MAKDFNFLRSSHHVESFEAGDTIYDADDSPGSIYGILEGTVTMNIIGEPPSFVEEGSIFGTYEFVTDRPRRAKAVAKTPARIAVIDRRAFLDVVQETPFFALRVMERVAEEAKTYLAECTA
ncbi:Crp/Fnr family transcriptional regulator [Salisaeta longa]|uniref:Crp/Fnr family transcriptional regulator n=1 Tax=Salisaeta longa TaxID=503170 RepID=UPI0003B4217D|nr:cyclic nucleotide-binding domain-containing protein [Salisaeta longa]